MASPSGVVIGRVKIRVLPDTSLFGAQLEADLAALRRTVSVQIPAQLDVQGVEQALADVVAKAKATTVVIPAQVNASELVASTQAAATAATKSAEVEVPVKADTDPFARDMLAYARRLAKQTRMRLPVTLDGEALRASVDDIVGMLEDTTKLSLPTDLGDRAEHRQLIDDLVKELEQIADGYEVKTRISVDRDKALKDMNALHAEALRDNAAFTRRAAQATRDAAKDAATAAAKAAADAAQAEAERVRLEYEAQVRLDTQRLLDDLQAEAVRIRSDVLKIPVEADTVGLRGKLFRDVSRLEALQIPVDIELDDKFRKDARTALQEIADMAAREFSVQTDVVIDGKRLKSQIEKVKPVLVPMADLDPFRAVLVRRLRDIERKAQLVIPTTVDGAQMRQVLRDKVAKNEELLRAPVTLALSPDAQADFERDAIARVEDIERIVQDLIDRRKASVKLQAEPAVDAGLFRQQVLRELARVQRQIELKIPATVDGVAMRYRLDRAVAAVQEALDPVNIPVGVEAEQGFRARIYELLAEVETAARKADPTIRVRVNLDRRALARGLSSIIGFSDRIMKSLGVQTLFRYSQLQRVLTQTSLVASRALAYVLLLGPALLLAAAGAAALAPALALSLPLLATLGVGVAAFALAFQSIFGEDTPKPKVLQDLSAEIETLRRRLATLTRDGLPELYAALGQRAVIAFKDELSDIASTTNQLQRIWIRFAGSTKTIGDTGEILDGVRDTMGRLGVAIVPVSRAFLDIAVASLPGLRTLSDYLAGIAFQFGEWIGQLSRSGQLESAISKGTTDLIGFLGGVGRIIGDVIDLLLVLEPIARDVFSSLGRALSTGIRAVTDTVANFKLGEGFFGSLALGALMAVETVLRVPRAIIAAFAPLVSSDLFRAFLAEVGRLAGSLTDLLATVFEVVTDIGGALAVAFGPVALVGLFALTRALSVVFQFLADHEMVVLALAAAYTARLTPAIFKFIAAVKWQTLVTLAASIRAAAVAAGQLALALGSAIVTPFVTAVLSLGGVALPAATAATYTWSTALASLRAGLSALAATLFTVQNVATFGFAAAVYLITAAFMALKRSADSARQSVEDITVDFNANQMKQAAGQIDELQSHVDAAQEKIDEFNKSNPAIGLFKQGLPGLRGGKIALKEWQETVEVGNEKLAVMRAQLKNVEANLTDVSVTTGLSVSELEKLANSKGIDLSQPFNASYEARMALYRDIRAIEEQSGLTREALKAATGSDVIAQWETFGKAVTDAVEEVDKAYKSATDVLGTLKVDDYGKDVEKAQKKVEKLTEQLADAQWAATHNPKGKSATEKELKRVQDLTKDLVAAQAELVQEQANSIGPRLKATYTATIAQAEAFSKNIQIAVKRGLDPQVVAKLMAEGPAQAGPILQAIVDDSSNALLKMVNNSEARLRELNVTVVEQARLTNIALHATTDEYPRMLNTAMLLSQEIARRGGSATAEELAKALNVPVETVNRAAQLFGLNVVKQVQGEVRKHDIDIVMNVKAHVYYDYKNGEGDVLRDASGKIIGHRDGGLIRGPGTTTSDSILRLLSAGEFVQPYKAVARYGVDTMEAIRKGLIDPVALRSLAQGRPVLSDKDLARVTKAAVAHVKRVEPATPQRAAKVAPVPALSERAAAKLQAAAAGPRTLVVVDADGTLQARFRVMDQKSQKQRRMARRLGRLGTERWTED